MANIVPAAVSSQLDDTGEERIHIANGQPGGVVVRPPYVAPPSVFYTYFINDTSPPNVVTEVLGATSLTQVDTDPATGISGAGYSPVPTPDGSFLTLVSGNGLYSFTIASDGKLTGVGAPASQPAFPFYGSWSPDSQLFFVSSLLAPFLDIYQKSGTTITKIAAPTGAALTAQARISSWTPDGVYAAVATQSSEGVVIYKRTGTALDRLAAPVGNPSGVSSSCCFSPDGNILVVSRDSAPFLSVYSNNHDDTFTYLGTGYDVSPGAYPRQMAFTADGTKLAMSLDAGTRSAVYTHNGTGGFTKMAALPSSPASGQMFACAWTQNNSHLLMVNTNSPYAHLWSYDGATTFTKLTTPVGMNLVNYQVHFVEKN